MKAQAAAAISEPEGSAVSLCTGLPTRHGPPSNRLSFLGRNGKKEQANARRNLTSRGA